MRTWILAAAMLAAVQVLPARADEPTKAPPKEAVEQAEAKVKAHMAGIEHGSTGTIVSLNDPTLFATLPDRTLFAVRFRVYPIARAMPEGMRPSNLMAVDKGGKIERIKDVPALKKLLQTDMAPAKSTQAAVNAVRSWLTLSQEFHQDGFFKFEITPKEIVVTTKDNNIVKAEGTATVMAGGNGKISVVLEFDAAGKLTNATETAAVRPGPRPICQATKLLDADPIVRRMAEADLLCMGVAARDYLMEQRASATPELRNAIDRLWQRIEKNGW